MNEWNHRSTISMVVNYHFWVALNHSSGELYLNLILPPIKPQDKGLDPGNIIEGNSRGVQWGSGEERSRGSENHSNCINIMGNFSPVPLGPLWSVVQKTPIQLYHWKVWMLVCLFWLSTYYCLMVTSGNIRPLAFCPALRGRWFPRDMGNILWWGSWP